MDQSIRPRSTPLAGFSCTAETNGAAGPCSEHCGDDALCPNTLTKNLSAGSGSLSGQSIEGDDFPLGKACDLSGEGDCEACQ